MSKKNPVAVVHEVPPERRRCGRLGPGKPGRKFREKFHRWVVSMGGKDAGTGIKLWAREVPEGIAWLACKAAP